MIPRRKIDGIWRFGVWGDGLDLISPRVDGMTVVSSLIATLMPWNSLRRGIHHPQGGKTKTTVFDFQGSSGRFWSPSLILI